MLYTITKSNVAELDMPLYTTPQHPDAACAVVFTTENTAKFFADNEPDSSQLAVAELRGVAILKLFVEMHDQGIQSVLVNPRPDDKTVTPACLVETQRLVDQIAEHAIASLAAGTLSPSLGR